MKLTSEGLWGIVRLSLQGTSAVVNQLDAISSGFRCKEPSNAVRLISSASYLCRSLPSGSCCSLGCDWAKEVAPGHMRYNIPSLFSTQKTPKMTCSFTTILKQWTHSGIDATVIVCVASLNQNFFCKHPRHEHVLSVYIPDSGYRDSIMQSNEAQQSRGRAY